MKATVVREIWVGYLNSRSVEVALKGEIKNPKTPALSHLEYATTADFLAGLATPVYKTVAQDEDVHSVISRDDFNAITNAVCDASEGTDDLTSERLAELLALAARQHLPAGVELVYVKVRPRFGCGHVGMVFGEDLPAVILDFIDRAAA